MTNKKTDVMTIPEAMDLIKEIRTKWKPDFIIVNDGAGEIQLKFPRGVSQVSITFGWYINKPKKRS